MPSYEAHKAATRSDAPWRGLLDPILVSRLQGIDLRARLVVEGFLAGLHRSPYRGFSVEFAEHRAYMPGDPLRHVDWKVFARSERLFVKEFEEETNLRCYLVVDRSLSMGYGPDGVTKLEYGVTLAAALAYLMVSQRDSVGLQVFSDDTDEFLPARSLFSHLGNIYDILERVTPEGGTGLGATFADLAHRTRRRGLVILISDLVAPVEELSLGLGHFRHKKHELIVLHLVHPWEENLPYRGTVALRDPESGRRAIVHPAVAVPAYRRRLERYLRERRLACLSKGADYALINTSTPYDKALLGYLTRRSRAT